MTTEVRAGSATTRTRPQDIHHLATMVRPADAIHTPRRASDCLVTTHEAVESECAAAYYDGIRTGVRMAAEAYGKAIAAALVRPDGHGGPDLDEETRAIVAELYGRYLAVPVDSYRAGGLDLDIEERDLFGRAMAVTA